MNLKQQIYHLIRPATFALDGFNGERVFAVRRGHEIKEQYRCDNVGDCKPIKPDDDRSESYIMRVK